MKKGKLRFGANDSPKGFPSSAFESFTGKSEPVIRELIQNSLDAISETDNKNGFIRFIIEDVEASKIPGWEDYKQKFLKAKAYWGNKKAGQTPSEKRIIQNIEASLQKTDLPVLICLDSGIGLNQQRLEAILSSGGGEKSSNEAGSFGVGHFAAFAASSLRYVIYSSKFEDEGGKIKSIYTGQAIVATHAGEDHLVSQDGFLVNPQRESGKSLFMGGAADDYPQGTPEILKDIIGQLDNTGTAVCIIGFNNFLDDSRKGMVEKISQVAASHFTDAIYNKSLNLSIEEHDSIKPKITKVKASSLEEILRPLSNVRKINSEEGRMRGEFAVAAEKTLREGRKIKTKLKGVSIKLRSLEAENTTHSRVHLFRNGMRIMTSPPELNYTDFTTCKPFDAVVSLVEGETQALVRAAENTEHDHISIKNLADTDRKTLRKNLKSIAASLRAEAGEYSTEEEFSLSNFALVHGASHQEAEKVILADRKSEGEKEGNNTPEKISVKTNPTGEGASNISKKQTHSGASPNYGYAIRSGVEERTIELKLENREKISSEHNFLVALKVSSGSDETCEMPIKDGELSLASISTSRGATYFPEEDDPTAILIPAAASNDRITITTNEPLPDIAEIEVAIFKKTIDSAQPKESA